MRGSTLSSNNLFLIRCGRVRRGRSAGVVTAKIVAEMEAGSAPWLSPWKSNTIARFPQNAVIKRRYSGINVPLLWMMAQARGFSEHAWLTYQQALAQGGQVRKGEKGRLSSFYEASPGQCSRDHHGFLSSRVRGELILCRARFDDEEMYGRT
jgi:antirestriction protein ArdC